VLLLLTNLALKWKEFHSKVKLVYKGVINMNPTLSRSRGNNKKSNPFAPFAVGILLFLGAFPVLFLNEAQENLANVAKKAVEYSETIEENTPVYSIGSMDATNKASDLFLNGDYVVISRTVEMYGYQETQSTVNSQDRYTYNKAWVVNPGPTSSWLGSNSEHPNDIPADYNTWVAAVPPRQTAISTGLSINGVDVDYQGLDYSGFKPLTLDASDVLDEDYSVQNNYLYFSNQGTGASATPQVGDIRLSFSVIEFSDTGILLGSVIDDEFVPFTTKNGNTVFRFFNGETDIKSVTATLQAEYELSLWIFRGLGFLMLFIGLLLAFKPLMSLFKFVPFFGDVGNVLLTIILFLISLFLAIITILLSLIVQNILVVISVTLVLIALFVLFAKKPKTTTPVTE
jgi:hypothetical protein